MSDDLQLRLHVHSNPAWAADEIERLHAEVAAQDKELCEMAQHCDDLSCENARLRAKLTIAPETVRRLAAALAEALDTGGWMMVEDITSDQYHRIAEYALKPALLAAGMEEEYA